MKHTGLTAIILFLGVLFVTLPATASAVELIANEPITIYYTTNGEEPTTTINTDTTMTTLSESGASTASVSVFDDFYTLAATTATWDGTDANRHKPPAADYASTYGDEATVTYTLPWQFAFYGQSFSQITVDTNGNIWFGGNGSAHSFNLANGHGPVIAAWNNDLSSYYSGGVFIQHKTSPEERVVIEWQTGTYTSEGRRRPNIFETVLFPNGKIRLDYQSFTPVAANKDFGSGISYGDGGSHINLTNNSGNVFTLAGQSFLATPINKVNLTASANGCGTITPTGSFSVNSGESVTFNIAANPGKYLINVAVDGVSVGMVNSYTFANVTANHTISADFITPDGDVDLDGVVMESDGLLALRIALGVVTATPLMLAHGDVAPLVGGIPSGDGQISMVDALAILWKAAGSENWNTSCAFPPTCSNQPVRISGALPAYYGTMQAAFDASSHGAMIQAVSTSFAENLVFQNAARITLNGGYGCDYAAAANSTTINGSLTISNGSVEIKNIVIR